MAGMTLGEAVVPDTAASDAALQLASRYFSPALLNHSVRVHVWAAVHGTSQGIRFDSELLYVASVLHDIGLVPEFDNDQAERKPSSAPAASVQADLDGRMAVNPLDERGTGAPS